MFEYDAAAGVVRGPGGTLPVRPDDAATVKLVMLLEGECSGASREAVAERFGYCRASYYDARGAYLRDGGAGLVPDKTGPKGPSRRTPDVTRRVIRARFLDPRMSAEVIASTLRQERIVISNRSVARIIQDYGLQRKTPSALPRRPGRGGRSAHQGAPPH